MLKTNFLGMKLKNPVIVSAGPWNRDGKSLKASLDAGAGAVVTESIVSDTILDVRPRIYSDEKGAQNIRLYSDIQVEGWDREISIAKQDGGVVIANVSADTPSEVAYLANKLEKYGADAIEISVSNPALVSLEVVASNPTVIYDMTRAVVSTVKIPVMVKLSQNTTNISKVARAVREAGGAGVSAINTVRGIMSVDLENAKPTLSTYGGISGEYIRPMGLASVATIAQSVDIPICGIGGISSAKNALEYIMLGADVVQVGTAVMVGGKGKVGEIVSDLENWLADHNVKSIKDIRGKALDNVKSFDEMRFEPTVSTVGNASCTERCEKCVTVCMYGAIVKDKDSILVSQKKCSGCGLCTSICPVNKLSLAW